MIKNEAEKKRFDESKEQFERVKEIADTFDESWSMDEYRELIRICLKGYCTWADYWNCPNRVDDLMKWEEEQFIQQDFANHETPLDVAVGIGYTCG